MVCLIKIGEIMNAKPYWLVINDEQKRRFERFEFESLEQAESFWRTKANDRSWTFGNEAKIALVTGKNLKTINLFRRRFGQWRTTK